MSSISPHKEIQQKAQSLHSRILTSHPGEGDIKVDITSLNQEWKLKEPGKMDTVPWYDPGAVGDNKVTNPTILPPGAPKFDQVVFESQKNPGVTEKAEFVFDIPNNVEKKVVKTTKLPIMQECQLDLIRAPVFKHDITTITDKVAYLVDTKAGGETTPITPSESGDGTTSPYLLGRYLEPTRMVVVSATFPFDKQLENFRKALRKDTVNDLFLYADTTPQFLGLLVKRGELNADNQPVNWKEWELVYGVDENGKTILNDKLQEFLTAAVFDTKNPALYQPFILPGLVTPLPELAFGEYPKVKFGDIKPGANPEGSEGLYSPSAVVKGRTGSTSQPNLLEGIKFGPEGTNEATGGLKTEFLELRELAKKDYPTALKLIGRFYPFDPQGIKPVPVETTLGEGGVPPYPPSVVKEDDPEDPFGGVEGENPFAKKPKDDDPFGLKQPKKKDSPRKKLLQFIDVDVEPGKTYIYSVQVRMRNPNYNHPERVAFKALSDESELLSPVVWTRPISIDSELQFYAVNQEYLDPKYIESRENLPYSDKGVTVQIHKWVRKAFTEKTRRDINLGTWVVADDIVTRRGEYVGANDVRLQLPDWSPTEGFGLTPDPDEKKPQRAKDSDDYSVVDLQPQKSAPLVLDYKGGRKYYEDPQGRSLRDDGSVQMLLLSPEGNLELFDSWEDSNPNQERGLKRAARYEAWHGLLKKMEKTKQAATQPEAESNCCD